MNNDPRFNDDDDDDDVELGAVVYPKEDINKIAEKCYREYLRAHGISESQAADRYVSWECEERPAKWGRIQHVFLTIPYYDVKGKEIAGYQVERVLYPPANMLKEGTPKFMSPAGQQSRPYLDPLMKWDVKSLKGQTVRLTEGPVKAMAMNDAGLGFAIGLNGVHGFRTHRNGDKKSATRLMPELEHVFKHCEAVEIVFDDDRIDKPQVQAAENDLATEVQRFGKPCRIVQLPSLVEGAKTDINDAIVKWGDKAVEEFAKCARLEPITRISIEQFEADCPNGVYWYMPTMEPWPATSVDASVRKMPSGDGAKGQKATDWLVINRPIVSKTWAPGEPRIIEGRVLRGGADWKPEPGARTLNLYMPSALADAPRASARAAAPWLDRVKTIYPEDWQHLVLWLAHRIQRPGEKINHAIVLQGGQGIGKDSILEPIKRGVGAHNWHEVSPATLLGDFNGYVKSVVLRVSEQRDMGEVNKYKVYEHLKTYCAAPPYHLRVNEKYLSEYYVANIMGVIITTNYLVAGGMYLAVDDRRHFVAASNAVAADFRPEQWTEYYEWLEEGGDAIVVGYLKHLDISSFNPKAPPPKTRAWHAIVESNNQPVDVDLDNMLEDMKRPRVLTLDGLRHFAVNHSPPDVPPGHHPYIGMLDDLGSSSMAGRLEKLGYRIVPKPPKAGEEGKPATWWYVHKRKTTVYGRADLTPAQHFAAIKSMQVGPLGYA